jgi:hypothetical protein
MRGAGVHHGLHPEALTHEGEARSLRKMLAKKLGVGAQPTLADGKLCHCIWGQLSSLNGDQK